MYSERCQEYHPAAAVAKNFVVASGAASCRRTVPYTKRTETSGLLLLLQILLAEAYRERPCSSTGLPGQCSPELLSWMEPARPNLVLFKSGCHIEPPRGSGLLRLRRMAGLAIGVHPAVLCHFLLNTCGGMAWRWVAFVWILCAASQCRTGEIGIARLSYEDEGIALGGIASSS